MALPIRDENLLILKSWVDRLQSEFPTSTVVDAKNNSITIKIRFDDVFRAIYKEVKKSIPDAKISLKPCEYDKKYGMCMVIKSDKLIIGWEEWGFGKPIEISGTGEYTYYVTLESLLNAFDTAWKVNNKDKPIRFKFMTRKLTPKNAEVPMPEIWHYVTIEFITVTPK